MKPLRVGWLVLAAVLDACATTPVVRVAPAVPAVLARAARAPVARSRRPPTASLASLRRCQLGSRVLAVGASTLGGTLKAPLRRGLAALGARLDVHARHSTSVVRPDYYDWLAELRRLLAGGDYDAVVISLGVNDNQPLRDGRALVEPDDPRWDVRFAARVDAYLAVASGPARRRPVVWIGPYAFRGRGSRVIGRRINRILAERVAAFGGPAFYVDVYTPTLDAEGRPIEQFVPRGERKAVRARGIDGVHLKTAVVLETMAEPTLAILSACRRGAAPRD